MFSAVLGILVEGTGDVSCAAIHHCSKFFGFAQARQTAERGALISLDTDSWLFDVIVRLRCMLIFGECGQAIGSSPPDSPLFIKPAFRSSEVRWH